MLSLIKKILFKKNNSVRYIKKLRKIGVRIGENTVFYNLSTTIVDTSRPWMLEIGNNVKITSGVAILTHGYDWSVLRHKYSGEVLGSCGKVKIGNNVFIGVNTTILKGSNIGDNVIIGANTLINKNIPSDVVVAGNPCRIIMSIDDYYKKRKLEVLAEMDEMVVEYIKVFKTAPPLSVFREHYFLILERKSGISASAGLQYKFDPGDEDDVFRHFYNSSPQFLGLDNYLLYLKSNYPEIAIYI